MTPNTNQPSGPNKTDCLDEDDESPRWLKKFKKAVAIFLILVLGLGALTLCLSLPVLYFVDKHKAVLVESVEPAGKVIAITLIDGLFTRMLVETDVGFYYLVDGISLKKNKPLTLEVRGNKGRHLCDETHRCTRLLEWL